MNLSNIYNYSSGDSLKAIIFKSTISGNELISYFQSVSTRKQNHIITLETPDIALVHTFFIFDSIGERSSLQSILYT